MALLVFGVNFHLIMGRHVGNEGRESSQVKWDSLWSSLLDFFGESYGDFLGEYIFAEGLHGEMVIWG